MREKLVSLEQAAKLVRTGDKVIMMGGLDNTPMALLREIVRGETTELNTVGVVGASMNLDFLVGAGRTATRGDLRLQLPALRPGRPQLPAPPERRPGQDEGQHLRRPL